MSVWFSSDWHLGSISTATTHRGFTSLQEHDDLIIDRINESVTKQEKLYILGDVAFTMKGLSKLSRIKCRNIEIILGNHDRERLQAYLDLGVKIHGFKKYKHYWLSHCPVHPNELYRCHGNIHGHVHRTGNSPLIIEKGYFNANVDMNDYYPIDFETIQTSVKLKIKKKEKQ